MNTLKLTSALWLILALFLTPLHAAGLNVEDAWIAEAPPVSKVLAAYMNISNPGDASVSIVTASSEDFGKIEFHRTLHDAGMASMQQQKQLVVDASGELKLEPGGYHMMLFNPKRALRAGAKSTLQLRLADGTTIDVVAEVRKAAMQQSHEHHHH